MGMQSDMISVTERIRPTVEAWLSGPGGAAVVSPAAVQSMLFDIYDEVKGDHRETVVTSWLTLTIQRELFSAAEIRELVSALVTPDTVGSPA